MLPFCVQMFFQTLYDDGASCITLH